MQGSETVMKMNFKSILYKMILMVTLVGFMQGAILIYMSYDLSKTTLLQQIDEGGLNYAEASSQTIGEWMAGNINELKAYANSSDVKSMNWDLIEPYLKKQVSSKLDIYDHLFVANIQGDYSTTLLRNAGNVSDRAYFPKVMQGLTVVSDPVISKSTGNQISVIAVPIRNSDGEVIGLLGGALNLVKLYHFIENSGISDPDSYSYIVDKMGTIITYPDTSYIMKENITVQSELVEDSLVAASAKILNNYKGYVEYTHEGLNSLNYFHAIPNTDGWRLVIKIPQEYVDAPLRNISQELVFMSLVALVVSIFLSVFVSRSISSPVIRMRDVFLKAADGDLSARADESSGDEIGQAAQSFNKMMQTISHLTFYDTLTALPNKLQFMDRLNHELIDCSKSNERLAVIVFDIDKFENINNALGPSAGDSILRAMALQIENLLDENEIACRLGDDRFAILLPNDPHETYAIRKGNKLLEMAKQPWTIESYTFYITASLGIAFYPNDGENAESLIKNALSAMLRAKKNSRDSYQLYDSQANSKLLDLISLDNLMHHAVDNNEFVLHYQPQVDISTGKIVGAEALIRWNQSTLGTISPAKFIPLAEENGLIVPIGDWVLETACRQSKRWMDMGFEPIYISVNISAVQIHQKDFIEKLSAVLEKTQLPPKHLEIEITESIAMKDIDTILKIMDILLEMGVRIAIDDFGTGYSSLSYLRKFQITTLKIDQSFTRDLVINKKDEAIVSTILAIGENLNLKVTAEGVETKEQLDFLREKKCDLMQGYLFSKPLPAEDFEELMKNPPKL